MAARSVRTYIPSAQEMSAWDTSTLQTYPAIDLMERAGSGMADHIAAQIKNLNTAITVLCGPGNNGGDGLVVARLLYQKGYKPTVIIVHRDTYPDAVTSNLKKIIALGIEHQVYSSSVEQQTKNDFSNEECETIIHNSEVIIDALLGTGQVDNPKNEIASLISFINKKEPTNLQKVIALDIPTGLNASTGKILTPHITASTTLTVEYRKRGMVQYPGKDVCGEQIVIPIGIIPNSQAEFALLDKDSDVKIPTRLPNGHKGTYGSVFVIGGSINMPGAPLLSALAALRTGAGTVTRTVLDREEKECIYPEIMQLHTKSTKGTFGLSTLQTLYPVIEKSTAIVLGPGMSQSQETNEVIENLIEHIATLQKKLVIDADGLNALAEAAKSAVKNLSSQTVITPHPGEAARLLNLTSEEIQNDRYGAAILLAKKFNCVVVLKGASTIIYSNQHGIVNETSTPYLATAGSGDVLSGIIASFMAQGLSAFDAAVTGVYIHSQAGIEAVQTLNGPIVASDTIQCIPSIIGIKNH